MDEPFSALDVLTARTMRDLVLDLWASAQVLTKSILLVTHSIEEAVSLSDRVVVLKANPGRIADMVDLTSLPRPRRADTPAVREVVDRMYTLLA
jgi:NitT/TauT family transport system ATP-binding protein